jgi:2-methylisocitrate lyase-like PEP mutase family enzyme
MKQPELYERLRALHEREAGFIMPNAWDGISALLLKRAGFQALGTSSAAIASAMGRLDSRHALTGTEHLVNANLMGELTNLPINGDFEDGYGSRPRDVAVTVEIAIRAGLAGTGIEDTSGNPASPICAFDDAGGSRARGGQSGTWQDTADRPYGQLHSGSSRPGTIP